MDTHEIENRISELDRQIGELRLRRNMLRVIVGGDAKDIMCAVDAALGAHVLVLDWSKDISKRMDDHEKNAAPFAEGEPPRPPAPAKRGEPQNAPAARKRKEVPPSSCVICGRPTALTSNNVRRQTCGDACRIARMKVVGSRGGSKTQKDRMAKDQKNENAAPGTTAA